MTPNDVERGRAGYLLSLIESQFNEFRILSKDRFEFLSEHFPICLG
jgi:hypothetical protein